MDAFFSTLFSHTKRFKTNYGKPFRHYRHITFEKEAARKVPQSEFVAPGHPLLEAVNEEILSNFTGNRDRYALFGDPEGQRQGVLWFVEGEVTDGRGEPAGKRVFCLYQPLEGQIQTVNAAILWDLEPLDGFPTDFGDLENHVTEMLQRREVVEDTLITEVLFPFKEEIEARRAHETGVKEKYGIRSLDYLIQESNQKILDYQMRQMAGDDVSLPLLNEQRNLESLQQKRQALQEEIRLERNLTVGEPRFLGAAVVIGQDLRDDRIGPAAKVVCEERTGYFVDEGVDAERRREIELVGMREAMAYERDEGWQPEDVSGENHGFDIRSLCFEEGELTGVRYIEVKARAQTGAIRLSANEWKKARRYGEQYWLYVVTQAASDSPQLERIQDPAAQFALDEDIFATGFIVPEDKWRRV